MRVDYDLPPTQPLRGLHFVGTLNRRWISSHELDPASVPVPEGVDPWLLDGKIWLSDCFVEMANVRPAGTPRFVGLPLRYLVHRIMANVPFPDGKIRKAVFVLMAYGDPPLSRRLGRIFGGAPFEPARIVWHPRGEVRVSVGDETVYEASFTPGWSSKLSLREADEKILGMSFGSTNHGGWRVFPETHDPWVPEPWQTTTSKHALLEGWGIRSEADHCIGMVNVPHYFAPAIKVRNASA